MASLPDSSPTDRSSATLLQPDEAGLSDAGERLRAGRLVAFPTETVYGLGANALDEAAVRSIFVTKGRPLTDPLIVHVATQAEALNLLEMSTEAKSVYELLASSFWPGPLTLVGKAIPAIPLVVTAGTGFVGIRCPKHELARSLLAKAKVPVAAPSANRFGHVSPTTARHVYQDLGTHNIAIIDGESKAVTSVNCSVGIESTVAKVDGEAKKVMLFRRGGVSEAAIRKVLSGTGFRLEALSKQVPHDPSSVPDDERANKRARQDEDNAAVEAAAAAVAEHGEEAPGQCLTHYAPDVPTSLLRGFALSLPSSTEQEILQKTGSVCLETCSVPLSLCVVVDFAGNLAAWKSRVLDYRDLSPDGDVSEAAHNLFDTLRWTEGVAGVKQVLLADLGEVEASQKTCKNSEHFGAVADRMFRAASGRCVTISQFSLDGESPSTK